jgi:hypothetical protein
MLGLLPLDRVEAVFQIPAHVMADSSHDPTQRYAAARRWLMTRLKVATSSH